MEPLTRCDQPLPLTDGSSSFELANTETGIGVCPGSGEAARAAAVVGQQKLVIATTAASLGYPVNLHEYCWIMEIEAVIHIHK